MKNERSVGEPLWLSVWITPRDVCAVLIQNVVKFLVKGWPYLAKIFIRDYQSWKHGKIWHYCLFYRNFSWILLSLKAKHFHLFPSKLNLEQKKALDTVKEGHNLLVTGQAGTANLYLVSVMCNRLIQQEKIAAITSGITGSVYADNMHPFTVYSHYGLWTAELSAYFVIEGATSDSQIE